MLATSGGYQEVERPGIDSFGSTQSPEPCGRYIGPSVDLKKRERIKKEKQAINLLGRSEAVQEFLENIADQEQPVSRLHVPLKSPDMGVMLTNMGPPQDKRPDRGVNDQIHGRDDPSYSPILS